MLHPRSFVSAVSCIALAASVAGGCLLTVMASRIEVRPSRLHMPPAAVQAKQVRPQSVIRGSGVLPVALTAGTMDQQARAGSCACPECEGRGC